ncbi:MAG: patatin-like phospholipase family protein [Parvibaculaceae bacterium]|nr:patatin-like phospholipase family protein [Parvibaculaceae bacterium]
MVNDAVKVDLASRPEKPVLVLQGGGALGAYQAGVYEELAKRGFNPEWIAGISIGAINAAIIAGNPVDKRDERLREFWDYISGDLVGEALFPKGRARTVYNEVSSAYAAVFGLRGFFQPRFPPAFLQPAGSIQALSHYDTGPLKATLERLVDFDLINSKAVRFSVGAVNVKTGNFIFFDNEHQRIGPEHIMASGALPPGFPPIEIDGEFYWDGGIVSNTPLQYVLDDGLHEDMLIFQLDLFNARGELPRTMQEVTQREKDIRFSSRTRLNTDEFKRLQSLRARLNHFLHRLPDELKDDPDARALLQASTSKAVSIVHLIYRSAHYETQSKDYEFSRKSVNDHWSAGQADVRRTLAHPLWCNRSRPEAGIAVFDLTRDSSE